MNSFLYKETEFKIRGLKDYRRAFVEESFLSYIKGIVKPNSVFVDCGANIGNHSIYFSKIMNAKKVYSFEAVPDIYSILKENLRENKIENVKTFNLGVSSKKEIISCFSYIPDREGAFWFWYDKEEIKNKPKKYHKRHVEKDLKIQIESYPLDEISEIQNEKIDFLKIDVEGMELEVLEGAKELISKNSPTMFVEVFKGNVKKFKTWCIINKYRRIHPTLFKYPNVLLEKIGEKS